MSHLVPFSANLAFVLTQCQTSEEESEHFKVLTFLQEDLIQLPACSDLHCDWEEFQDSYKSQIECNFEEICDENSKEALTKVFFDD